MSTYLITGASRGLGLQFTKQLARRSDVSRVIATSRSQPTGQLHDIITISSGKVVHVLCDVMSQESVENAVGPIEIAAGESGLDVLINNVGIQEACMGGIANMPNDQLNNVFNGNVLSAHRVTAALMPLLRKGQLRKVVNISSTVGSITMAADFRLAPQPAYKVTKAALNMLTVQYSLDYANEGFTFVALSPGYLQTDLTKGQVADLPPEDGAQACIDQIMAAGPEKNGRFLNILIPGWEEKPGANKYDGKSPPW